MRRPSRTLVVSAFAVVAAAAGGAAVAPAALSASNATAAKAKRCSDTCKDKKLIKKTTGGQKVKKWSITSSGATQSVTVGEVTLNGSCGGGSFNLTANTTSSSLTGTLDFHGQDVEHNGVSYARVDRGFGSGSSDSLNDVSDGGQGGSGVAEVLLSDGTVETIDYAYAPGSTAGTCDYWGDAIYG